MSDGELVPGGHRGAVDLFAGPGGWSLACRRLGLTEVGVEWDDPTVATREAAGFDTIHADIREVDPLEGRVMYEGLIASPPCPTFSMAGNGSGRRQLDLVIEGLEYLMGHDERTLPEYEDYRTGLTLEPMKWILARLRAGLPYRWIALEQVPSVQPVWNEYAKHMRTLGYHVATGCLQAEEYGVPQTRRRAILIAHWDKEVMLPAPTHMRYRKGIPQSETIGGLKPWVSMADALGGDGLVGFPRRADGRDEPVTIDGGQYRSRDLRATTEPAQAVTEKARSWTRWAPTFHDQTGTPVDEKWPFERPSTTVAGRGLVQNPGATANRFNGSTKSRNDGVKITIEEAGVLQGFPVNHPWQGKRTHQFTQAGNAIPVPLAHAVLKEVL